MTVRRGAGAATEPVILRTSLTGDLRLPDERTARPFASVPSSSLESLDESLEMDLGLAAGREVLEASAPVTLLNAAGEVMGA